MKTDIHPDYVVARVHCLDVAVGLVQPGQDEKVVAGGEVAHGLAHLLSEDDPGVGRSFAALHGRVLTPRE